MDTLTKLKNEASRTHAAWGEIRARRSERERELQELHHQAGEAQREAQAFSLLPEHDRPEADAEHPARIADLDAKLGRLDRLEQEAEALKCEAHEELQREVRKLFPAAVENVQATNLYMRDRLADVGQAVVKPYLVFLEAQAALAESDAELATLRSYLAGSDRKAIFRQKSEVKGLLDAGVQDASDLEILGQILTSIIRWSRRGSSPIEDLWTGEDLAGRVAGLATRQRR